jgi:hypothetical protein
MPGFVFDFDLWLTGHVDVPRPDFYFSDKQPQVLRLRVTPPPLLYLAFDGDIDKLVYTMKRLAQQSAMELRARQGRPPLGARAISRLHPWSEPRTLRESRGQRVPSFRIGARGIVGQQAHVEAALETRGFRDGYRQARLAREAGDMQRLFPFGTYQMRVRHGAAVATPDLATAIVTRPGPSLSDVQRTLDERRARGSAPADSDGRFELVDCVRQAMCEQAEAICEHASDDMDFHAPARAAASAPATPATGNAHDHDDCDDCHDDEDVDVESSRAAIVRHRFDKHHPHGDASERDARRIITLRDRRRGRPTKSRHGSDPPA